MYSSDGSGVRITSVAEEVKASDLSFVYCKQASFYVVNSCMRVSDDSKIKGMERDFKSALIDHIWNLLSST